MIEALARFVDALRAERQPVSPAEVIDASRALDLVGLSRRADVKAALRATLAKDRRAAEAFDRLFDRFFAPPRFPARGQGLGRVAAAGERGRPSEGDTPAPPRGKPKESLRPKRAAPGRVPSAARPLAEILERARRSGPGREGRLRRVKVRTQATDASDPTRRDLTAAMPLDAEREIAREVARLVAELKLRPARRRVSARAGRPWLRQALRENLSRGGVPFVIPLRAPKRKATRVVLLVDVSFSVARASALFLLMAGAFLKFSRNAKVLAFVDRPVDATGAVLRWVRGSPGFVAGGRPRRGQRSRPGEGIRVRGVSFADVLDGLAGLNPDAPSDYGTAFHALRTSRDRPHGRDTVLVVLGDGRTNRFDPLVWALEDLSRGCKAVIWLAAEPASRWGTADSALPAYLPAVDVLVEAGDLAGLATGMAELVKRL